MCVSAYICCKLSMQGFFGFCPMIGWMEIKLKGAIASFAPWQAVLGLHSAGVGAQHSQGCPYGKIDIVF